VISANFPMVLSTLKAFNPMTTGDTVGRSATKVCESICESLIEGNPRTVAAKGSCATSYRFASSAAYLDDNDTNGVEGGFSVARLNTNGSLDTSFGNLSLGVTSKIIGGSVENIARALLVFIHSASREVLPTATPGGARLAFSSGIKVHDAGIAAHRLAVQLHRHALENIW
jgi:hypothetical protein